jgi:hypothetical protein
MRNILTRPDSGLPGFPGPIVAVAVSTQDREVLSPYDGSFMEYCHVRSEPDAKS